MNALLLRLIPLVSLLFASFQAHAQLTIDIVGVGAQQIPVAVAGFAGVDAQAQQMASVIEADLARSGLIKTISGNGLPKSGELAAVAFPELKARGADATVIGSVSAEANGLFAVSFRLVDVPKQEQLVGLVFNVAAKDLRPTAHRIADIVYERLTGEKGVFSTRLAYVAKSPGRFQLIVADSDGFNAIPVAHYPKTSVVALENTVVREAGSYYTLDQVAAISKLARSKGLAMHLDGARFFNAITETGDIAGDYGKYFDTISICLSKGLGAPVGSVLLCKKELEPKARRIRKVFGGGMRQAGFIAAAGLYALENNISRLKEDHERAQKLSNELSGLSLVKSVMPVDTNIIIFELSGLTPEQFLSKLAVHNIKALAFGPAQIRLVTHLDFSDQMLDKTIEVLKKL